MASLEGDNLLVQCILLHVQKNVSQYLYLKLGLIRGGGHWWEWLHYKRGGSYCYMTKRTFNILQCHKIDIFTYLKSEFRFIRVFLHHTNFCF